MHFVIKISKQCNLRCLYCYEYDELHKRERIDPEMLRGFFRSVRDAIERGRLRSVPHFVLHGGEPLLQSDEYLASIIEAKESELDSRNLAATMSVQSNLTRLRGSTIDLLSAHSVSLGLSFDVCGDARVDLGGADTRKRVLANLEWLLEAGYARRLGLGGISVLHRLNLGQATRIYEFWERVHLDFRLLPVFDLGSVPSRMAHLTLTPNEIVSAFKDVADMQMEREGSINVYPLLNYLSAAVAHVAGIRVPTYEPEQGEWAMIIDTNGDAYHHGGSYDPAGFLGNVWRKSLADVLASNERATSLDARRTLAEVCLRCRHAASCSHLPMVEALPSERIRNGKGQLICGVARPLIDHYVSRLRTSRDALGIARRLRERVSVERPTAVLALDASA
jgi:uncharacterized protein